MSSHHPRATIRAGVPHSNPALFHLTKFSVGDPVASLEILKSEGKPSTIFIVRDVEPALYRKDLGAVRVEDMVVVTATGHENLNHLPEGLDWK